MGSKIGNLAALRALGEALKIRDSKVAPDEMSVDQVIPVATIEPGWAGYELFNVSEAFDPVGYSGIVIPLVCENLSSWVVGMPELLVNNAYQAAGGKEVIIYGIEIQLVFDVAGAGVMNNLYANLTFERALDGATNTIPGGIRLEPWLRYSSVVLAYYYSMPYITQKIIQGDFGNFSGEKIWVPAKTQLGIRMGNFGTNFPANTLGLISWHGVKCPPGLHPPLA